jgi:DNA excision repair protein ERCC-2
VYSIEEFEESRFCRDCETYLLPKSKAKELAKETGRLVKPDGEAAKQMRLPNGYELRKGQMEFIEDASKAVNARQVFVGNAPCGIGKSLASLLAVLPHLDEKKLLITFRTRSQLHIYLKELRAVGRGVPIVSLSSKQGMCPMRMGGNLSYYDFFEQCKNLKENCEPLRKPYCRFYLKNLRRKKEADGMARECAHRFLTPDEATRFFVRRGFCAYEALRSTLNKARIFLGTFHYVFDPKIRRAILKDLGVGLDDVYLIVDEAHNVPAFARELLSDQITEITLDRALRETERFVREDVASVRAVLEVLNEQVFQPAQKLAKQELKRLQPSGLDNLFLEHCGAPGSEGAKALMEYGEYVKTRREELGQENLLSYNYRVGEFLGGFFGKQGEAYIHLVSRDRWKGVVLEVRGFDGREVSSPVLTQTLGSVLMSGSLSPPQIYRDLMLNDSSKVLVRAYDSPFPAAHRLILGANDVSSRFELRTPGMFEKWRQYIEAVSRANIGNVAFFFTSYNLMQSILGLIQVDRKVLVEHRKTRRGSVLNVLQKSTDAALFGVMGGKFSEGIDYPGNVLTCVVAVGLPYATWNVYQKGLIDYYDQQFPDQGELYAYLTPAVLRLVQAAGRVHRSPADKGCIVILDERVARPNVKRQLPKYMQQELKVVKGPTDCSEKIDRFWREHRAS